MRPVSGAAGYLVAGCFGKLPFWPEFLEVNVVAPVTRAFRTWIREGRQAAGMATDAAEVKVPPEASRLRFVFGTKGSAELLAGVIRPSTDIGGKRPFPFTVFAHIPRRHWSRSYALLPMALERVWDALDDVWDSVSVVASESAFREILVSTRVPAPPESALAKSAYDAGQGQAAARIFADSDGTSVEALKANLPEMLKLLKSQPTRVRLELPASAEQEPASYDATFWVDLINRQFFWRRFEPTIFLDGAPRQPDRKVFLLFGDPAPSDYARVMGMERSEGTFQRPAHAPSGVPVTPAGAAPTYAELAAMRFVA